MKFIIGKKIEMSQVWQADKVIAVTKILVTPCTVVQVKNVDKDGYEAVQLGYGNRKEKNINKPQKGHFKDLNNFEHIREFRTEMGELKRGDNLTVSSFKSGDGVQVSGVSKGKGFQGVVRRHGFKGSKKTHGNKDQLRMPGSIGATGPAHVFKGTKMGGRMGGDKVTIKNLKVIEIDEKENYLYINGAIPGARNSYVYISGEGNMTAEVMQVSSKDIKKEINNNSKEKVDSQNIASKEEKKAETPEEVKKEVVEAKKKIDEKSKEADKEKK
jgi:large subunit ribosomal protein L3